MQPQQQPQYPYPPPAPSLDESEPVAQSVTALPAAMPTMTEALVPPPVLTPSVAVSNEEDSTIYSSVVAPVAEPVVV